eukprot:SAG22_NODE_1125_length_5476_cov_11.823322_2_plen_86_part_00
MSGWLGLGTVVAGGAPSDPAAGGWVSFVAGNGTRLIEPTKAPVSPVVSPSGGGGGGGATDAPPPARVEITGLMDAHQDVLGGLFR